MKVENTSAKPLQESLRSVKNEEPALQAQLRKKEAAIQGPPEEAASEYSPQEAEAAITKLNRTTEAFSIGLRFKLHKESERIMVQIVDVEENEIIKEIPPEKLLNLAAQIQDMIGLMLDTKR